MIVFKCKHYLDITQGTELKSFFTNRNGVVIETSNMIYDIDRVVGFGYVIQFDGRDHKTEIALNDILKLRSDSITCLEEYPKEFVNQYIFRHCHCCSKVSLFRVENETKQQCVFCNKSSDHIASNMLSKYLRITKKKKKIHARKTLTYINDSHQRE